jgi:outer membrane receptor protein involved in Fe transport
VTPFGRWIDTELALSFLPSEALEETGQAGGGVQSALYWDPDPRLSLVFGFDADRTRGRLREEQTRPTLGTFVQGLHYDYVVDSRALALFGQARLEPAPRWRIDLGLRAEQVAFDYDTLAPVGDFGRFRRPADRRDAFLAVSPKFGVSRTVGDRWTSFLSFRRGARPPQASDLYSLQTQQTPGEQGVERLDQVEGGVRFEAAGARVELVAFWAGRRGGAFRNADGLTVADARTRGVGAELAYAAPLVGGLRLEGWVARAEHTYRFEDRVTSPSDSIVPGALVDTAPRWLAQNALVWRARGPLNLRLDWRYNGGYFTNAANTARQEGFSVVDLRAGYAFGRGLEGYVLLRNALDARFPERADFAFGAPRFFPGEPIAFRFGLSVRR